MNGAPAAAPGEAPLTAFLVKQLEKYNVLVTETHQKIYGDLSTLKDTMVENIDKVLERGEHIDLLVDKTDSLHESSFVFRKGAQRLKREMWWQNTKLILGMAGGATVSRQTASGEKASQGSALLLTPLDTFAFARVQFVLYVIISSSCGGMTWPEC